MRYPWLGGEKRMEFHTGLDETLVSCCVHVCTFVHMYKSKPLLFSYLQGTLDTVLQTCD